MENSLLDQMLSISNLDEAISQVKRNKGAAGIDGMTVKDIPTGSDIYWAEISNQIRNRKYKPSPVRRVQIPKEDGSMRDLGIPTVTDRVIQQAMVQVLTPIYEPLFNETSYGFRPGRSCEMAILKALEYMNDGYEWIVDIDLRKFFDTVNHDKLISEVMKNVKDGEIVSLIRKFLTSGVVINHEFQEGIIGLQQGETSVHCSQICI
jgi:group II intron reverse transcriptase/maturase